MADKPDWAEDFVRRVYELGASGPDAGPFCDGMLRRFCDELRARVGEPDVAGAAHRLLSDEPTYTDDVFGRMAMRKDYRAVARAYLGIALPAAPKGGD